MSSTTPGSACIWQVTIARSRTCLQWTDRSDRDAGRPAGSSIGAFVKLKHQPAQCTRSACALSEPEPEPVVSGCSHIARRICWQSDHTHVVSQSTIDSLDDLSFVKGEAGLSLQPMHVKTMDYWNMLVASGCSGNGGMGMETDRKQQQPHVLRTSSRFQNQDHPDRKRRVSRMHMV